MTAADLRLPNATALALLDAAQALLAEGGTKALSARAVAERAGVRKGLVFYYWPSLDALVAEALTRYYEAQLEVLERAATTEGELPARMHAMVDAYLDFAESSHAYARIVQEQVAGRGAHLELVATHLRDVVALVTRGLEGALPARGPLSLPHFHLTLSALMVNYFTYAPVFGRAWWGKDPLGRAGLAERRAHVHWVVDACLSALDAR
ncbi:MAG: TetR/AcrR family transcriptional regulator [Myxococcales bacterium]|nr:TetR/AcrR family transcriptional regulator [Myxococcales bacterium]